MARKVGVVLGVLAFLALPYSLNPKALFGAGGSVIVANDAQCQGATECKKKVDYICSTSRADYIDYECSAGCGGAE